jgi:hypothetical protein
MSGDVTMIYNRTSGYIKTATVLVYSHADLLVNRRTTELRLSSRQSQVLDRVGRDERHFSKPDRQNPPH